MKRKQVARRSLSIVFAKRDTPFKPKKISSKKKYSRKIKHVKKLDF